MHTLTTHTCTHYTQTPHIHTHTPHIHSLHTHHTTPHTHTFMTHTHTHTLTTHNMHTHTYDTLGNEAIVGIPQGVIKQKERAPMKGDKNSGEEEHGTIGDVENLHLPRTP